MDKNHCTFTVSHTAQCWWYDGLRVTNWTGFGNERSRPNKTRVICPGTFLERRKSRQTSVTELCPCRVPNLAPADKTSKTNSLVAIILLPHTFYTSVSGTGVSHERTVISPRSFGLDSVPLTVGSILDPC